MNIKLEYVYRDAGNYKNHGSVVFANLKNRPLAEVVELIAERTVSYLIWKYSEMFFASDWGIPDLHFTEFDWDDELDHYFHEIENVGETNEKAVYDLEDFLLRPLPLTEKHNQYFHTLPEQLTPTQKAVVLDFYSWKKQNDEHLK